MPLGQFDEKRECLICGNHADLHDDKIVAANVPIAGFCPQPENALHLRVSNQGFRQFLQQSGMKFEGTTRQSLQTLLQDVVMTFCPSRSWEQQVRSTKGAINA